MTTRTVSNVTGVEFLKSMSQQPSPSNAGNVGRIVGSVLGCAVVFVVIVSIGIIVARYYYHQKRRLTRNGTLTLSNVTFPDDGVDNEAHTTVEDNNYMQPVMSAPTFCSVHKVSTDKTRTIENLPTGADHVYENTSTETLVEAKETIYENVVNKESEACEIVVDKQQLFPEEAVSMSDPQYLSMEHYFLDDSLSGETSDSREDLYIHPVPDTMADGQDECFPNPI